MTTENENTGAASGLSAAAGSQSMDIGTRCAQALADGRYGKSKAERRILYGQHEDKPLPTDTIPKGKKFGGQYPF